MMASLGTGMQALSRIISRKTASDPVGADLIGREVDEGCGDVGQWGSWWQAASWRGIGLP